MDSCLDKTPSTPEMFDFDDSEKSETRKKGMKKIIGRYDISTPPPPEKHEVGVQAHFELEDKEVQRSGEDGEPDVNDEGFDMTDVECIDGVLCKYLCMAEANNQRETVIERHEKDENGFYKLKKGITSDSGAGDTVGPDDEFPDYPLEESPGPKRGLHYLAAGGEKIKNTGQKKIMILTKEKELRRITVQIAKVKKTLGSVSKSNDHGFDVLYSSKASYMNDEKTQEKIALRRERAFFVLDAWVIPFEMSKTGIVKYKDDQGKLKAVKVTKNSMDFSRPAR